MAYKIKHRQIAEHNEDFFNELDPSKDFTDWIVTGKFYAAIHWIDSYFLKLKPKTKKDKIHKKHSLREKAVKRNPDTNELFADIKYLRDQSQQARYQGKRVNAKFISKEIDPRYDNIKYLITTLLSK